MRKLLLACALFLIWPVAASSGPKEDALLVVEQFKKAFDASDVEGVVKLFAPDAVFLGTVSPILALRAWIACLLYTQKKYCNIHNIIHL